MIVKKSDYLAQLTSKNIGKIRYIVIKDCLTMKEASDKLYENKLKGLKASEWTMNKIERMDGVIEIIGDSNIENNIEDRQSVIAVDEFIIQNNTNKPYYLVLKKKGDDLHITTYNHQTFELFKVYMTPDNVYCINPRLNYYLDRETIGIDFNKVILENIDSNDNKLYFSYYIAELTMVLHIFDELNLGRYKHEYVLQNGNCMILNQ